MEEGVSCGERQTGGDELDILHRNKELHMSRVYDNLHGLIRKYDLMCCRQCFHSKAGEIGFNKVEKNGYLMIKDVVEEYVIQMSSTTTDVLHTYFRRKNRFHLEAEI
nr:40S ribosomal protein S29 [Tanacetum cinerariifolium]